MVPGHVLRDVTLDIERGSAVCLVGASGSGKSVLLKILAGVLRPTVGRIEFRGRLSALVRMGGNLDDRQSALENIENHRTLSPFPTPDSFAEEVIRFAELEGFERALIRTYSKGMTLRLSAALALAGDPAILLLDDVLGVGDIAFQQACIERLHALKEGGCTIVAALSDEALIEQLATRVITLSSGRVVDDGSPKHWLNGHHVGGTGSIEWDIAPDLPEDDVMALRTVALEEHRDEKNVRVVMSLVFEAKVGPLSCRPSVFLMRERAVVFRSLFPNSLEVSGPCRLVLTVELPTEMLASGDYRATIGVVTQHGGVTHSLKADAVSLRVRREASVPLDSERSSSFLATTVPWEIERVSA